MASKKIIMKYAAKLRKKGKSLRAALKEAWKKYGGKKKKKRRR